ncbi:MAG: multidrug effflux MFS transporter [Phycisphaerae bacterium]|nr:multidrug effflux MFS transporter [Phycisphaerae bacterium]
MGQAKQRKRYTLLLGLIATVPPLATDMYLPALPRIAVDWKIDESTVNLSLVLWFAAFSVTLLVWGSLSDRYGRRPILLSGLIGFIVSSGLCALSGNVYHLIAARILQGVAAAGASSMVMAIARDYYDGVERQRVLAWIGIILGIAPMVAPSIGAAILKYADWRFIFVAQAVLATVSLSVTVAVYGETAKVLDEGGLGSIVSRYGRLLRNTNYVLTNGATGLLSAPFFGFIGFSGTAYIVHFGMSEQAFGLLFGANALCAIAGSAACTQLIKRQSEYRLVTIACLGCLAGGVVLLLVAWRPIWILFAGGMGMFAFCFGMSRPLINHLILEQVDRDIGAAASGIVCYQFIAGASGMALATRQWGEPFLVFGLLVTLCPLAVLAIWPVLLRRILRRPDDQTVDIASQEAGTEEFSGG